MSEIRALLLTDVVDSTQLSATLGDAAMAQLWAAHDRLARDLLPAWRGREIDKTDGMLLLFEAAADAADFALAYHRALGTLKPPLRARAGLHVGPVILRENSAVDVARGAKPIEVDGLAKPTAARVMSLAQAGQTLLTSQAREALGETHLRLHSHGHWRIKGVAAPIELFEVGDADSTFAPPPDSDKVYRVVRSGTLWLPVRQIANNLPQQLSSFVGRARELAACRSLLETTRLLTLTGAGGSGKTRLGLQIAASVMGDHADGVWLVELAPLADPGLVPQTVATVLGLKEQPGKPIKQTLGEHLKDKRLLLMLDNCEHLLDACASLADALVRHCPGVQILASSREALGIGGEQAYRVPSLSLPDPKQAHTPVSVALFEAVQLFTERATLARADFQVTDQNASTLASICYRLDGIPLAIELAAARVRSLSVEEIHRKLDERFRLLTGGSRTALPRHQTLRSLIDWSYDLLSAKEQALLRRLSVFAAGWTLATAEPVCSGQGLADEDMLDLLTALADKSLVGAEQREGSTRYRLLETVRQYARDRLLESGEGATWRDRHLACFLALAEAAELQLKGADQQAWLDRLETEHDNLRSALEWSAGTGGDAVSGLRLAGALCVFWEVRGYLGEGRGWLGAALAATQGAPAGASRAKALNGAGVMAWQQADYSAARALHQECLETRRKLGNRVGIAGSLNNLGNIACEQGDFAAARMLYEESLAIKRELGDRHGMANSLNNLGIVACDEGDYAAARALYAQSLVLRREIGDRNGIANSLNNLGGVACEQGDYAVARALYEESLAIHRELGSRHGVAVSLSFMGTLAKYQGDHEAARALYVQGLTIWREVGDRGGIADALEGLAQTGLPLAGPDSAARIWGAVERLRQDIGAPLPPGERPWHDRQVAAARAAAADHAAFDRAWQEGRELTLEQAMVLALQGAAGQG